MAEENKQQETEEQSQQQNQSQPQKEEQPSTARSIAGEDDVIAYSEPTDGSGGTTT
ncbi:MAG TPA: hypothetical protein VF553_04460 [Pyrinomonadaceae bacterium]|jgi:methionyl-tRNA formyltransferase